MIRRVLLFGIALAVLAGSLTAVFATTAELDNHLRGYVDATPRLKDADSFQAVDDLTYEDAFAESCAISGIAADERAYLRSGGRGVVTLDPPRRHSDLDFVSWK